MRGFIDIWSFLSWGYRKRNDPPHGVAHAEDDLAGFPDDFWKIQQTVGFCPTLRFLGKSKAPCCMITKYFLWLGIPLVSPDHLLKLVLRDDGDTERTRLVELASGRLARKDKRRLF